MRNLTISASRFHTFPNSHISSAAYDVETNDTYVLSERKGGNGNVDFEIFKLQDGREEVSRLCEWSDL